MAETLSEVNDPHMQHDVRRNGSQVCAFIDDGYTETRYIEEEAGLHPSCRFTYRPMTPYELSRWTEQCEGRTQTEIKRTTCQWMAAKIQEWDLRGPSGESTKPTADLLLKLRPRLFDRMMAIVWGDYPGDKEPEDDQKNLPTG